LLVLAGFAAQNQQTKAVFSFKTIFENGGYTKQIAGWNPHHRRLVNMRVS
jgi:hypothetical protein